VVFDMHVARDGRIAIELPLPDSGGIVYYLDSALRVTEARFSDNLAAVHERMRVAGLLDHRLTEAEMASWRSAVPFGAAPDGNSPEVARAFGGR
jgi:hypothetical protein